MEYILLGRKASCIAELTAEHNVHYHCLIEIEGQLDKDDFLNRFREYNKFFGRKSCRGVDFKESFITYLRKDYQATSRIIVDPIVKDDYKIFYDLTNPLKMLC